MACVVATKQKEGIHDIWTKLDKSAERRRNPHTYTHTGSLLVSIFATIFVISPAFTSGVPSGSSSADCDSATLNTYSGT